MFFIMSIFHNHHVNSAHFLLRNLKRVIKHKINDICVGELVTHIAIALGLQNKVSHLTPTWGFNLLDIDHCLNYSLVWREGPDEFIILINHDIINLFTLPNQEFTLVHDKDNWLYTTEDEIPPLETSSSLSIDIDMSVVDDELYKQRQQINRLTEKMDHIFLEVHALRKTQGQHGP